MLVWSCLSRALAALLVLVATLMLGGCGGGTTLQQGAALAPAPAPPPPQGEAPPELPPGQPGTTWTLRNIGSTVSGIAFGNGMFVAVGPNGAVWTSQNGLAWTARASGTNDDLLGVTFANGLFVAVGGFGIGDGFARIMSSPDGIGWTTHIRGPANSTA